ncbi:MAG: histidine--tRNA ligase [Rhodovibrionaceae bacterium]|nr:histidine--tRNA ligase [Rhodovibrionaceae bacterium]
MKRDPSPPRGMRDILPSESELRDRVAETILATYRSFGFRHIETPGLERIEMLAGSGGGDNEKLIFKVLKRGEKLDPGAADLDALVDLGLRYDLTVPLARYYAANRSQLPRVFKAIQMGPVWRAERPQRGRFRQFTQCDIDTIGSDSPMIEAELLSATSEALLAIGFEGFEIRLNDRRVLGALALACGFAEAQLESVFITLDKLDKIGLSGVREELGEKSLPQAAIDAVAEVMGLLPEDRGDFDATASVLREAGVDEALTQTIKGVAQAVRSTADGRFRVAFDPFLVRGMGYYTGPIFEVQYKDYPFSIAGGGRYDEMIGAMTGEKVPASGISIGFERVITILQEEGGDTGADVRRLALIVGEDDPLDQAMAEAARLRERGYAASILPRRRKLGPQLKTLKDEGYTHFCVYRHDEAEQSVEPTD